VAVKPATPTFFDTPAAFRRWLRAHHRRAAELWVGFHKKGTGRPSLTWPESVDEALCFGWIDGLRRSIDAGTYMIRFTPRRPGSIWSAVNIRRAEALLAAGRMQVAGRRAFEIRVPHRSVRYSYERAPAAFAAADERRFRRQRAAWTFFQSCPPWYRRVATHWVVSAAREDTRQRRLDRLIEESAAGRHVVPMRPKQE
jgi:uncharacterized protein YdeI (YjbR/CyaY-like superfamily)